MTDSNEVAQAADTSHSTAPAPFWAQCDKCNKWRRVTRQYGESEKFYCYYHPPNTCETPCDECQLQECSCANDAAAADAAPAAVLAVPQGDPDALIESEDEFDYDSGFIVPDEEVAAEIAAAKAAAMSSSTTPGDSSAGAADAAGDAAGDAGAASTGSGAEAAPLPPRPQVASPKGSHGSRKRRAEDEDSGPSQKLLDAAARGDLRAQAKLRKRMRRMEQKAKEREERALYSQPSVERLLKACEEGNARHVQYLLEAKTDVDAQETPDGELPLFVAAREGHLDVAKALLDAGAAINLKDPGSKATPLTVACRRNRVDVVRLLVDRGARASRNTPVHVAIPHPKLLRKLLKLGADPDTPTEQGLPPLVAATHASAAGAIDALLLAKADVNKADADDIAPLWVAAFKQDAAAVAKLLATPDIDVNAKAIHGDTPLWAAVLSAPADSDMEVGASRASRAVAHCDRHRHRHRPVWCLGLTCVFLPGLTLPRLAL